MANTKKISKTSSKEKKSTRKTVKAVTTKSKKGTRKTARAKQDVTSNQSFIAFLGLLVMAGFLIGGLFASVTYYQTLLVDYMDGSEKKADLVSLPATGLVQENDLAEPEPEYQEPGSNNTSESAGDPRQPAGTVEFKNGDYKVYQYPDGRIVVVW